jgi:hypothetical protein
MPTATLSPSKPATGVRVIRHYDVAADAKNRISLRQSKAKYFHVKALSDGSYLLEPRVLVAPHALSARTRRMLEACVKNLKQGQAAPPIDLTPFQKE